MSISRNDGKNLGSIAKVWIKLWSEITDTQEASSLLVSDDLSLTGTWTLIELVPGEGSWQESEAQGQVHDHSVQLSIHKDRREITDTLQGFVGRKLMAIVEDRNNQTRRLLGEAGFKEYHARLSYSASKELGAGKNGYSLQLTCQMDHPAYYYTGAIPV
jgi:hypothetical protein